MYKDELLLVKQCNKTIWFYTTKTAAAAKMHVNWLEEPSGNDHYNNLSAIVLDILILLL